ncbi:MAG: hypothetical protein KDK64_03520 [Chlamydiia bacterium]|nr:hypothetical protein [Chlamydiia bacterium]
MSQPLKNVDISALETEVLELSQAMYSHLHSQVEDGKIKTKLHDQLIWLNHQIRYFSDSQDVEQLLENVNWVISNFNHDLSLPNKQLFRLIDK